MRLSYVGPPSRVGSLAEMLRGAGLDVRYVPPRPSPPSFEMMTAVALFVQGVTPDAGDVEGSVGEVVDEFRARFPNVSVSPARWRSGTEG